MYAEVVVLTYQAPDIGAFTYEIPKNLEGQIKIGQLVKVPFGERSPLGIISSTDYRLPTTDNPIKPITSIIFEQPILLPYQIQLLKWMAGYYFAPMVNCLEAMLPALPSKQFTLPLSGQAVHSSQKITVNRQPSTINQTLVLIPSINRLPETLARFPHAKNYIFYHNQLKTAERFANWLKILGGNVDFVFGSRSAIFAPCPNLAKIIIFDEHDGAYKDERSPYFDTLTISEKIVELTGAKLEIIDSSPKITTYFVHKNEITSRRYSSSERSESRSSRQARTIPKVKIVSMADERQTGNKSPISSQLAQELRRIRKIQGRSLLFLNKKAESGQIYCRACKQQNYAPKVPAACPNCQSPDIFFHSLNINSLAGEVKKIVPQSAIRFFTEGSRLSALSSQLSTCDIATSAIFYAPLFQKYDLVAHVSTDSILHIADLNTSEKLYSQISDLKKLTKDNGTLILQTYSPESDLIKIAAHGDFKRFYESELDARKMLSYPPFSLLVKLTIKGKNQDVIFKKAKDLAETLKSVSGSISKSPAPVILGPFEPVFLGRIPRYNIILKASLNSYDLKSKENAAKSLLPYISKVPKGWQVTLEPDSLN